MTPALIVVLAVYAAFLPALVWALKRLTRPAHMQRLRVPRVLIDDTMVLTSDSDHVGFV